MIEILINGAVGGVTGYLTNWVALQMIFKKVLGVGGVIPKNYQEFRKGLGELVSRHLLTPDTLAPSLNSPLFKKGVEEVVTDVIKNRLPARFEGVKFGEVPGWSQFQSDIGKVVQKYKSELQQEEEEILEQLKIGTIFQPFPPQLITLLEQLFSQIFAGKKIGELLPPAGWVQIERGINTILEQFIQGENIQSNSQFFHFNSVNSERTDFERETDWEEGSRQGGFQPGIGEEVWERLKEDLIPILYQIEEEIGQLTIAQFMPNGEKGVEEIVKQVDNILNSYQFEKFLEDSIQLLFSLLKKATCIKMDEVVVRDKVYQLKEEVGKLIGELVEEGIILIYQNQEWLEKEIEKVVDKHLSSGNLVAKVVYLIKELLEIQITKKYQLVEKIIQYVRQYGNEGKIEIAYKIEQFFTRQTIGEGIIQLEQQGLLSPPIIARYLKKGIQSWWQNGGNKKIVKYLSTNLLNSPISKFIEKGTLVRFIAQLIQSDLHKFLNSLLVKKELKETIKMGLKNMQKLEVKTLLPSFFSLPFWKNPIPSDLTVKDFFTPSSDMLIFLLERLEEVEIPTAINGFTSSRVQEQIRDWIIFQLITYLPHLPPELIARLVEQELAKLSPEELAQLANRMFGKELTPINLFGGILGATAGIGYGTLLLSNPIFPITAPLIYGATGVATNYLAIKMLFRPYKKRWWLPFLSPGVVVKQKAKIADGVARFVSEEILEEEKIVEQIQRESRGLVVALLRYFRQENFSSIVSGLKKGVDPARLELIVKRIVKEGVHSGINLYFSKLEKEREWLPIKIGKFFTQSSRFIDQLIPKLVSTSLSQLVIQVPKNYFYIPPSQLLLLSNWGEFLGREIEIKLKISGEKELKEVLTQMNIPLDAIEKEVLELFKNNLTWGTITSTISNWLPPDRPIGESIGLHFRYNLWIGINEMLAEGIREINYKRKEIVKKIVDEVPMGGMLENEIEEILSEIIDTVIPTYLENIKEELKKLVETIIFSRTPRELGIDYIFSVHQLEEVWKGIVSTSQFKRHLEKGVSILLTPLLESRFGNLFPNSEGLKQKITTTFSQITPKLGKTLDQLPPQKWSEIVQFLLLKVLNLSEKESWHLGILIPPPFWKQIWNNFLHIVNLTLLSPSSQIPSQMGEWSSDLAKRLQTDPALRRWLEEVEKRAVHILSRELTTPSRLKLEAEILKESFSSIPPSLAEWITKRLLVEVRAGVVSNTSNLLKGIDLYKTTHRAILGMDGKELEEMFNSFATPYFKRLISYGAVGGVFSLPTLLI